MADYSELLQDQDDDDQGMRAVRKAAREADKRAREAEERAAKAEARVRASIVQDLVKKAGLKEAVARYVPKDVEDADALEVWLKSEEGSVFAEARSGAPQGDPVPTQDDSSVDLFAKISRAESGGDQRQPVNADKAGSALAAAADRGLNANEIQALFAALDSGKVPGS